MDEDTVLKTAACKKRREFDSHCCRFWNLVECWFVEPVCYTGPGQTGEGSIPLGSAIGG